MKFIEFLSLAPPKHQSEWYPTTSKDFLQLKTEYQTSAQSTLNTLIE